MCASATNFKPSQAFLKFLLVAAMFSSASTVVAAVFDVTVGNNFFEPKELQIQPGDTVRWTNPVDVSRAHDVTADDGSFNSETRSDFVFQRTFNTVGNAPYHCTVHSVAASQGGTRMNGTIIVMPATVAAEIGVDSVDAVDGGYQVGDSVEVMARLSNNGDGDSGMFVVTFSASPEDMDSMGPIELGTVAVNNIAAGASMEINGSFALPVGMETGYWSVSAVSDLADGDTGNDSNADATAIFVFTQFIINAGLNDAWFNKTTDGQGFFITVFPELDRILLAWFTYDTELPADDATANLGDPGHRWLLALGSIDGNMSETTIEIAKGGRFDTAGGVSRVEDGSITLKFKNCNEGSATYNIPSISAQGVVPIRRIAKDNVALCRALLKELTQ